MPDTPSTPESELDLRGGFEIETPEQVAFRMERAGLGSRIVAALVDSAILLVLQVALLAVLIALSPPLFGDATGGSEAYALGLVILLITFLLWGYYIGFEITWNGQTPGKRLLGIRVVGDGGVPVTAGQVVVRNLLRAVDSLAGYAVGLVSIFATRDEKRLGDLAAGTVVVSERRRPPGAALPGVPGAPGRAVDPRLLYLLRDYLSRSTELDGATRSRIAHDLANRLARSLGRAPVPPERAEAELRETGRLLLGGAEGEKERGEAPER